MVPSIPPLKTNPLTPTQNSAAMATAISEGQVPGATGVMVLIVVAVTAVVVMAVDAAVVVVGEIDKIQRNLMSMIEIPLNWPG